MIPSNLSCCTHPSLNFTANSFWYPRYVSSSSSSWALHLTAPSCTRLDASTWMMSVPPLRSDSCTGHLLPLAAPTTVPLQPLYRTSSASEGMDTMLFSSIRPSSR